MAEWVFSFAGSLRLPFDVYCVFRAIMEKEVVRVVADGVLKLLPTPLGKGVHLCMYRMYVPRNMTNSFPINIIGVSSRPE